MYFKSWQGEPGTEQHGLMQAHKVHVRYGRQIKDLDETKENLSINVLFKMNVYS